MTFHHPVIQFSHPRRMIPPPLMMSEPGSFAQLTLTQRWPAIGRRVTTENNFSSEIITNLETLGQDLSDGHVRQLQDGGPDLADWGSHLEPYVGKPWLEVPWFFAEVYFYRRLLEATRYFQRGEWQGVDPFLTQKRSGLESAMADIRKMSADTVVEVPGKKDIATHRFISLLYSGLWGNRADLSLRPTITSEQVQGEIEIHLEQTHILVDDSPTLVDRLRDQSTSRIDVIADNAGFELVCDLYLIDFLLAKGVAQTVHLHLKSHPTFVSDATIPDVAQTLEILASDTGVNVRALAERLQNHIAVERLQLSANPFWTAPLVFWQMPQTLQQDLAQSNLVVIKGDANYRRLLGDCHWAFTESFQEIVCYFPAPLIALRTLKSEVVAGLQQSQIDQLNQEDQDWLTSGRWGLIQYF